MRSQSQLGPIVLSLLTLTAVGCQTTGDPTQGGLFGWSEKKAQQRQQALEQENTDAQNQLSSSQQQQTQLRGQQASLQTESARLHGEIDRLMTENGQLEEQLRGLARQHRLDETEFARLNAVLDQNEKLRQMIRTNYGAPPPQAQPDVVNNQNNRLHQEIMLLLSR